MPLDPWTPQQLLTVAVALVSAVVALVSLHRTGKLQRQQARLHTKQEELINRQLESLQKQATAATSSAAASVPPSTAQIQQTSPLERADVRVDLEQSGRDYKFVITNWGLVSARQVTFALDLKEGQPSPLVQGDYDEKIPMPELPPGGRCRLFSAVSFGSGSGFSARWTWRNPDGSLQERSARLDL